MTRLRHGYLVLAGIVLPFLTILLVFGTVAITDLPDVAAPFVLLAGPLLAIVGVYAMGALGSLDVPTPSVLDEYFGAGGPRTFRDEIPAQYEAAFSHETLEEERGDADERVGTFVRYYLVYLATLPVHTLVFLTIS